MTEEPWPRPLRRDVGGSDLTLFIDALASVQEHGETTAALLREELSPRMHGLRLVQKLSASVAQTLIEELQLFGWVAVSRYSSRQSRVSVMLTDSGREALRLGQTDRKAFLWSLAERMHSVYVIPGWFVSRLWAINPSQGEVIFPAPSAEWSPASSTQEARAWTPELREQTLQAAAQARGSNPLAFPVDDLAWHDAVQRAWERLRDRKTRRAVTGPDPVTSSRSGLTLAMRMAALNLLFGSTLSGSGEPPFPVERPVTPKTFKLWAPRLQALEFVGYTDWHPQVTGRLMFPTAVFRARGGVDQFEAIPGIRHPDGRTLFLHQPPWEGVRERFCQTLVAVYEETFRRVQARYVSLPDVRDEACRRLRLSLARFDVFLEHAMQEIPQEGEWHFSLETDMREDLRTSRGLNRRPVYVRGVPHTLIAIARLSRVPRSAS